MWIKGQSQRSKSRVTKTAGVRLFTPVSAGFFCSS